MKDIDNYTDEEGDPCFGMPNPVPKQSLRAMPENYWEQQGGKLRELILGKANTASDHDTIFEAEVIIQELIDHYGYYSGPYDPVWSSIDKARKFLKRNEI